MTFNYDNAARAMQNASRLERHLFVSNPARLPPPVRANLVPFIGWIGPDYAGGTVVIGKDPGGFDDGSAKSRRLKPRDAALDTQLEDALLALPVHGSPSAAMHIVSDLYLKQMPYNGIHVGFGQIAATLDEPIERMAFFNLCPYRTHGPSLIRGLTQIAIHLVPALNAYTILVLNKSVENDLRKLADPTLGAKWPIVLRRRRSDSSGLHDDALAKLRRLAENPEWKAGRESGLC
jgi:hypothetical protein